MKLIEQDIVKYIGTIDMYINKYAQIDKIVDDNFYHIKFLNTYDKADNTILTTFLHNIKLYARPRIGSSNRLCIDYQDDICPGIYFNFDIVQVLVLS